MERSLPDEEEQPSPLAFVSRQRKSRQTFRPSRLTGPTLPPIPQCRNHPHSRCETDKILRLKRIVHACPARPRCSRESRARWRHQPRPFGCKACVEGAPEIFHYSLRQRPDGRHPPPTKLRRAFSRAHLVESQRGKASAHTRRSRPKKGDRSVTRNRSCVQVWKPSLTSQPAHALALMLREIDELARELKRPIKRARRPVHIELHRQIQKVLQTILIDRLALLVLREKQTKGEHVGYLRVMHFHVRAKLASRGCGIVRGEAIDHVVGLGSIRNNALPIEKVAPLHHHLRNATVIC